jgi:nucleoid-associated protein YgaU
MTIVLNYDQENMEVESLPEYVRDSDVGARDAFVSISARSLAEREAQRTASTSEWQSQRDTGSFNRITSEVAAPKTDELEALWPGVHQDFLHSPKRTPSFYLTLGFMAGAVISMVGVWGYSMVGGVVASLPQKGQAKVATVGAPAGTPAVAVAVPQGGDPNSMLVPAHTSVEIQTGDTLAAIALREYKRVSPRLLDEICKANGLKNANFLSLGQKINLPNYQTSQSNTQPNAQVAASADAQVH